MLSVYELASAPGVMEHDLWAQRHLSRQAECAFESPPCSRVGCEGEGGVVIGFPWGEKSACRQMQRPFQRRARALRLKGWGPGQSHISVHLPFTPPLCWEKLSGS